MVLDLSKHSIQGGKKASECKKCVSKTLNLLLKFQEAIEKSYVPENKNAKKNYMFVVEVY